jgi:GNAT superfamily N-acetyltransferase
MLRKKFEVISRKVSAILGSILRPVPVTLRPVTPADEEFLFSLFVCSRHNDLSFVPEPQRSALLRMQFNGQRQTYTQRYPVAEHSIVSLGGSDAGRVWVAEAEDSITVVDIALMPAYRNQGIGAHVYGGLIERAKAAGKPLHATVSTANQGSLRFHERLGFHRQGADGFYLWMVRFCTNADHKKEYLL